MALARFSPSRSPFPGTLYCRTLWECVSVLARRCILRYWWCCAMPMRMPMYSTVLIMLRYADEDADVFYNINITSRPSANTLPQQLTSKSTAKRLDPFFPGRPQGNSAFRPSHPAQRWWPIQLPGNHLTSHSEPNSHSVYSFSYLLPPYL